MKEIFNKSVISTICSAVVSIIMGIVLIAKPDLSLTTIGILFSCYIIIDGIILIFLDLKARKYGIPIDGMIPGILSIVLGGILVSKPEILSTVFGLLVGIWIILSSINSIRIAFAIKSKNTPWILFLITGILDLIVGIIAVFNPFESAISVTILAGVLLIIHSIFNIINMIILKKHVDSISEIITESLKEVK